MLWHILRPFSYLTIDHRSKWVVDWVYPIALTVASVVVIFGMKVLGPVSLYADSGLISKVLGFVQGLPGFYIAALAAIATFNRIDIDKTMPSPAPTLDIRVQGKTVAIELTRRRFLCSMFAFLTAENLILIVLAIFSLALYPTAKSIIPTTAHVWISAIFMFGFLMLFWQMIVTSFWGLYYLGDKLHQPDA